MYYKSVNSGNRVHGKPDHGNILYCHDVVGLILLLYALKTNQRWHYANPSAGFNALFLLLADS